MPQLGKTQSLIMIHRSESTGTELPTFAGHTRTIATSHAAIAEGAITQEVIGQGVEMHAESESGQTGGMSPIHLPTAGRNIERISCILLFHK